jgi:hypothetical protein
MPLTSSSSPDRLPVIWSLQARVDLELVIEDSAVREQLKNCIEEVLHETEEHTKPELAVEEGRVGEIMWHRGWTHAQRAQARTEEEPAGDGPWNYVLFYRKRTASAAVFEVLAVRSRGQIADWWERTNGGT